MATYKVTSDRTSLGSMGATVDDADLEGVNVAALIEGGHISEIKTSKAETSKEEK